VTQADWETRIARELVFGQFISWREISEFHQDLESLLAELEKEATQNLAKSIPIFEIFIAGCLEKSQEIDDSGNHLGMFLEDLFRAWTRACSNAGMSGDEYIRKLAHWKKVDDIGYCSDIEETVIPALGPVFREALQRSLEEDFNKGGRQSGTTLKKLFGVAKDSEALISFCKRSDTTEDDCLALATIFREHRDFDHALQWTEKGLKLHPGRGSKEYELKKLRRELLKESGRPAEALSDAWMEFETYPSIYSYRTVMDFASEAEQPDLKSKALKAFEKADLNHAVEALQELGEQDRLFVRVTEASDEELQKLFYGKAIAAAEALANSYPREAARLYVTQALLILDEKRSKAYHHAHHYLEAAKNLLEVCGQDVLWARLVMEIRRAHRLKSAFMPGFEQIVTGKGAPREPGFMDRIANKLDKGKSEND
jgi:uncharacterized Zn finger protein